jgi:serine/threonine-protein kinase
VDSTVSDPLVGQLLDGRYLVGERIARGGMATVYEATDLRLDRPVALKVMPQALVDDDTFRQRFVREARAAARLTDPNVVAVYDQGEHGDILFLAMEYVPGRHTLRDVIRTDAPLPPTRALTILEEVLKAIAAAHDAGIVHRDIKPENVLIDPRGQIKVADFGLARAISSATAATATGGVLMGTVSYLPPELVTEGSADARSDVYALGVLLFELLTGTKPHTGDTPIQVAYKHVHDDVPPPSSVVEGIPPYVDALVARATSRQRNVRPADAHVMLQQLRRVRHALDNGVIDDQELTDDLTPTIPVAALPVVDAVPSGDRLVVAGEEVFDIAAYDDFIAAAPVSRAATGPARPDERTLVVGETPPLPPHVRQATVPEPPPPSRRRGWIAFAVVLLLAAAAAAAGWWFGVGRFESTPDVVNMNRTAAEQRVEDAGLTFEVTDTAYSESIAEGKVISTDPGPGENVVHDGTVEAVVSQGPERHDVPDLEGMTESEAIAAITDRSLTPTVAKRRYDDDIEKGGVISWTPEAGTPLHRDDEVDLVISRGPRPIEVTDYTGRSADDAESELSGAGLDVKVDEKYSNKVDEGTVISQRPDGGRLFAGDEIVLVVSRGPHLVEVPDVYLSGVDAAEHALQAAGFEVEVQEGASYLGLGYVTSQEPEAGSMAQSGSTITITII